MIVTFYSYKGGVGRSMALANVAELLSRRGLRVLMVDFDLEAPGLEKFFPGDHGKIRQHLGLLDLLASYKRSMARESGTEATGDEDFKQLRERFIVPIYPDLPAHGSLELLSAGRRGEPGGHDDEVLARYAQALRTFDWQDFYFKWGGELFFEWLRRELHRLYDVVLVDSRTGLTEVGGVCAYQLADALVMLCASNRQNVDGVLSVVRNFGSPRVEKLRRGRPPRMLVVPARVEQSDPALVADFRERFEAAFDVYTPEVLAETGRSFWDLAIPYEPRYAFEERVARSGEDAYRPDEAFQRLAETLTLLAPADSPFGALRPDSEPEVTRGDVSLGVSYAEPEYDVTRRTARYDVFLSYHQNKTAVAELLAKRLAEADLRPFFDRWDLAPGRHWTVAVGEALLNSRSCAVLIGSDFQEFVHGDEIFLAIDRLRKDPDFHLIPVLLPGADASRLPPFLTNRIWVDFRGGIDDERAFESLVSGIRGVAPSETSRADVPPYPGLAAFREQEAAFFFGREKLIKPLAERLGTRRCLFLVGPSGCGKSSLVFAGLLPALRAGEAPGSESWRFATLRPGESPLRSLAEALAQVLAASIPRDDLEKALHETPDRISDWVEDDLREAGPLVLIVDQLEELWTLCDDEDERGLFALRLMAGLASLRLLRLVLTLRADFIHRALEQQDLARLLQNHQFVLHPLDREELRRTIEEPARRAGLAFEPGLVDVILDDVEGQPGALPLAQAVLARLWERRQRGFLTHEVYQRLGGAQATLSNRAETVFDELDEDDRRLARQILLRLVQIGEEGVPTTRRLAFLEELVLAPGERDAVERVVDRLAQARLVRVGEKKLPEPTGEERAGGAEDSGRGGRGVTVELVHDALIVHWERLRAWIDEERESLRYEQRLYEMAFAWQLAQRDSEHLLGESRLAEATAWAEDRGGRMNILIEIYLEASREARREEARARKKAARRRRDFQTAFAATLATAIAVAVFVARVPGPSPGLEILEKVQSSSDGRYVTLAEGKQLGLQAADGELKLLEAPSEILATAFSLDGSLLALGLADGTGALYELASLDTRGSPKGTLIRGHEGGINALAFRPGDQALATVGNDGSLCLWDPDSNLLIFDTPAGEPLDSVVFGEDGESVRATGRSGRLFVWDAYSGERLE